MAHIDRIKHTVIGLNGERADHALGQTREILAAVERTLSIGPRMFLVEIVDHDKIKIGTRRHFTSAEPAKCQHCAFSAADIAVRLGKFG